jgi:hypothetical protein
MAPRIPAAQVGNPAIVDVAGTIGFVIVMGDVPFDANVRPAFVLEDSS